MFFFTLPPAPMQLRTQFPIRLPSKAQTQLSIQSPKFGSTPYTFDQLFTPICSWPAKVKYVRHSGKDVVSDVYSLLLNDQQEARDQNWSQKNDFLIIKIC